MIIRCLKLKLEWLLFFSKGHIVSVGVNFLVILPQIIIGKKVTSTTSTVNLKIEDSIPSNKRPLMEENNITTAMFTKLLATNIVANNLWVFPVIEK